MSAIRSTVDSLQAALTYHRERHAVLAGNIANLDTPGFKPLDLARSPSDSTAVQATSDPAHLALADAHAAPRPFEDAGALQGPDGNAVALERELAKIDANRTRYATTTELVSRRLALLRYAAGDGT